MAQIEYIGSGALKRFADILAQVRPTKVLVVAGAGSYAASGAEAYFSKALEGLEVARFSDLHAVLKEEDVQRGVELCKEFEPDLVVAVGGGHVLDAGKAINFFAGRKLLVAVPTTAGSGAEATPFAVIYKDGKKTSLEDPALLPTYAIVDPTLLASVPPTAALASALDALCQSIESHWARGATEESRKYAAEAMELVWGSIEPALEGDAKALERLAQGAHLSGKAIAISKTTAAHALSYGLTYRFGVPHGIAVAYTMPAMMRLNGTSLPLGITPESFAELLGKLSVPKISSFSVAQSDIPTLVKEVNVERLGNNPRALTERDIIESYESIWSL